MPYFLNLNQNLKAKWTFNIVVYNIFVLTFYGLLFFIPRISFNLTLNSSQVHLPCRVNAHFMLRGLPQPTIKWINTWWTAGCIKRAAVLIHRRSKERSRGSGGDGTCSDTWARTPNTNTHLSAAATTSAPRSPCWRGAARKRGAAHRPVTTTCQAYDWHELWCRPTCCTKQTQHILMPNIRQERQCKVREIHTPFIIICTRGRCAVWVWRGKKDVVREHSVTVTSF